MSHYIDGYVLPIHKDKLEVYQKMALKAGAIWREHGALEYRECVSEDIEAKHGMRSFTDVSGAIADEVVIFAYITFNSREHRDEVNAKVFADPRLCDMGGETEMPFDCARMAYGGFRTIVEA